MKQEVPDILGTGIIRHTWNMTFGTFMQHHIKHLATDYVDAELLNNYWTRLNSHSFSEISTLTGR